MKNKVVQRSLKDWLYKNWPKATIFLAIYTLVLLFLYLYKNNFLLFLIWLQIPVYWLHQFEEYILPGGFKEFFNKKVSKVYDVDLPITDSFKFWVNIPLIWVAFPLFAGLSGIDLQYGVWIAYFSIINGLAHLTWGIQYRGYNPGLVVSVLMNIPIGIFTIMNILGANGITSSANIISIVVAILVQGALTAYGIIRLKKYRRSKSKAFAQS